MSWASFNVVEVMSQSKFTAKRIGYLAASQSFSDTTEVVMLTTNLIRKVRENLVLLELSKPHRALHVPLRCRKVSFASFL